MRDPWLSLAQSCPLPLVWWAASRLKLELDDQDSDWDRDRDTGECWCLDPGGLTLLQSPLKSDNLLRHQDIFSQAMSAMSQAMRWHCNDRVAWAVTAHAPWFVIVIPGEWGGSRHIRHETLTPDSEPSRTVTATTPISRDLDIGILTQLWHSWHRTTCKVLTKSYNFIAFSWQFWSSLSEKRHYCRKR